MSFSPFDVLGVSPEASQSDIRIAWRKKAASLHPDVGGSHAEMVELNQALTLALSIARAATLDQKRPTETKPRSQAKSFATRDMSCFTIDALPVDAWHVLHLCASECGPLIDENEPYMLEFMMHDTSIAEFQSAICRCEIVPEAGGSMVHLSVFTDVGKSPGIELMRDYLVATINSITAQSDF